MTNIERVFIERDQMTPEEAHRRAWELQEAAVDEIAAGATFADIEELFLGEGLEMDYFDDLI